jgi:hypothetical protein
MEAEQNIQVIPNCSPLATIVAGLLASGHYTRPDDEDYHGGRRTSDDCRLICSYQEAETHFSPLAVSDAIEILKAIEKWEERLPAE